MKWCLFGAFFFACAISDVSTAKPLSLSARRLVVVADTWCPYNCNPSSDDAGFMVDIAREILAHEGYETAYRTMPWTDALTATMSGQADAIIGAAPNEVKSMILAGEPLGQNMSCLYTRLDDPYRYKRGISLEGRRLGAAIGYLYGGVIDQYIDANRSEYSLVQLSGGNKPLLDNYRKLSDRRVDTLVENYLVMEFSMKKYRFTGIRLAGCDEPTSLHIAFSPTRPDAFKLAEMINEGIRHMRSSGRLKEILSRYNTGDWKN